MKRVLFILMLMTIGLSAQAAEELKIGSVTVNLNQDTEGGLIGLAGFYYYYHEEKTLKITIPENIDYQSVFDDIFEKYTKKYDLLKTKSSNMGSLFILTYEIILKDKSAEKKFLDEIRCRNGNLEIQLSRVGNSNDEL